VWVPPPKNTSQAFSSLATLATKSRSLIITPHPVSNETNTAQSPASSSFDPVRYFESLLGFGQSTVTPGPTGTNPAGGTVIQAGMGSGQTLVILGFAVGIFILLFKALKPKGKR